LILQFCTIVDEDRHLKKPPQDRPDSIRSRALTFAIAITILSFFSVPLGFIFYGGASAAIGGAGLIGCLIVFQLPVFMLFKWMGWLPAVNRRDD